MHYAVLAAVSGCYPPVWGRLPTRYSPVRHSVTITSVPKKIREGASFDLHVLSTPPAFILSQDQTLIINVDPVSGTTGFFKPLSFSLLFLVAQSSDCCSWCQDRSRLKLFQNLSRLFHCSVIKVLCCCCFATAMIGYHSFRCLSTTFFIFFFVLLSFSATAIK